MQELKLHFQDEDIPNRLKTALQEIVEREQKLIWLCIGTDKQIADGLGPLTGTMLNRRRSDLTVLGTLDQPVHAKNLSLTMKRLREQMPGTKIVAIDAAAGASAQIGMICLREGSLIPGKAMAKGLAPVGDYALTAIVAGSSRNAIKSAAAKPVIRLALVYTLAEVISEAIDAATRPLF